MKKEFITPMIKTVMLSARDRVLRVLESGNPGSDTDSKMTTYIDVRPEEKDHWYGLNRQ